MKTTKWIATVLGLMILGSWASPSEHKLGKAQWLIGVWENKTTRGSLYESWRKVSDKEFSGKSYTVKGADTVVLETVRLVEEQDQLYYIPTVSDQNNGKPVRFKLTRLTDEQFVAENPEHDFPQTITYTKRGRDSLMAEISGRLNGTLAKRMFPMRKVN